MSLTQAQAQVLFDLSRVYDNARRSHKELREKLSRHQDDTATAQLYFTSFIDTMARELNRYHSEAAGMRSVITRLGGPLLDACKEMLSIVEKDTSITYLQAWSAVTGLQRQQMNLDKVETYLS